MTLYLVDPAVDLSLELPTPLAIESALALQWERLKDRKARDAFCKRMASQLSTVLPESIDWDIKPPTPAQLAYAMGLSRQLGVPIPSEAKRYRGHMHEFLEVQGAALKRKHQSDPGAAEPDVVAPEST